MNLDALVKVHPLPPQVLALYEEVRALSGKDIDFREVRNLGLAAKTKMARQRMAQHILFYDPQHSDRLNHLLAHEFAHILRMLALSPAERLVPVSQNVHIRIAAERLSPEMGFLSITLRPKMLTMWVTGLVMQLTNLPVDVRVEQWLAREYPGLKQEQAKGLKDEVNTSLAVLSPDVEKLTAPTVFLLSNAMNYAYLRAIGPILGEDYLAHYKERDDIIALGEQLCPWLEDGTLSDVAVVNRWADALDMSEWFSWRDFEDMPESYYQ